MLSCFAITPVTVVWGILWFCSACWHIYLYVQLLPFRRNLGADKKLNRLFKFFGKVAMGNFDKANYEPEGRHLVPWLVVTAILHGMFLLAFILPLPQSCAGW